MEIRNFDDFTAALLEAGFSVGGADNEVFSLLPYSWNNTPEGWPVRWHTGDAATDPWEWRMRVLEERDDIAYGKVFFRKSGYITRAWYPSFLAARRQGREFDEIYADGEMSHAAKRIYTTVQANGALPMHAVKQLGGFAKEDAARFDRAVVDLQMKLYLTLCGRRQKRSKTGEEYGWSSTVLCTTEDFWGQEVFDEAARLSPQEGADRIAQQVLRLNPQAKPKKLEKFIWG